MANSLAQTLAFSEAENSFESFLSYHPENMCNMGNVFVTFKDGDIYTHDDAGNYNRFYGIDYPSYIKAVFNQNGTMKKSFVAVTEGGSTVWEIPEIKTQVMSYGSTPQESKLFTDDFEDVEGQFDAAFWNDINSDGGLADGATLKGKWLTGKFMVSNAGNLVILNYIELKSINSPLNSR